MDTTRSRRHVRIVCRSFYDIPISLPKVNIGALMASADRIMNGDIEVRDGLGTEGLAPDFMVYDRYGNDSFEDA